MNALPLVSCLMPVKNYHERYLRDAIGSVTEQTCSDWRLLIVVEKQQRADFVRLLSAELRDPRVSLVNNEGKKLGGALNTGLRNAATDFVGILLGDDLWSKSAVEVLTSAIRAYPEVDFFHSSRFFIDDEGRRLGSIYSSKVSFSLADFAKSSPVKHLLCFRRAKGLSVGGLDESLDHGADDFDFPWLMARKGAKFRAISEPLYIYRDHREAYRLTTHIPLEAQKSAIRKIMRKHGASDAEIRARLTAATGGYLQQCLFRTLAEQRSKKGFDPKEGWRLSYR